VIFKPGREMHGLNGSHSLWAPVKINKMLSQHHAPFYPGAPQADGYRLAASREPLYILDGMAQNLLQAFTDGFCSG
jgi:hypothetical protein